MMTEKVSGRFHKIWKGYAMGKLTIDYILEVVFPKLVVVHPSISLLWLELKLMKIVEQHC